MTSVDAFMAYIEKVRSTPFTWGKHDCLTFTNGAVAAYRGSGFADGLVLGYCDEEEAGSCVAAFLAETGARDIIEAVDARLSRLCVTVPPRASVVARRSPGVLGYAFGVMVSDKVAFVGARGLAMLQVKQADICWSTS